MSQAGGEPEHGQGGAQSTPPYSPLPLPLSFPPLPPPLLQSTLSPAGREGLVKGSRGSWCLDFGDPRFISAFASQPSTAQESVSGALSQLLPIHLFSSF